VPDDLLAAEVGAADVAVPVSPRSPFIAMLVLAGNGRGNGATAGGIGPGLCIDDEALQLIHRRVYHNAIV